MKLANLDQEDKLILFTNDKREASRCKTRNDVCAMRGNILEARLATLCWLVVGHVGQYGSRIHGQRWSSDYYKGARNR